jgi:hypothetical protein
MKVDTLDELMAAFEGWRSKKRHMREAVPPELRERVHRAIDVYGLGVVARTTKLEPSRLKAEHGRRTPSRRARKRSGAMAPSYSRMELAPPPPVAERAFAEVETPAGVKVRLFGATAETMGLVTSLLAMAGGTR